MDPQIRIEGTITVPARMTVAKWVEAENHKVRLCACGCQGRIEVLPYHHYAGIPRFIQFHHYEEVMQRHAELRAAVPGRRQSTRTETLAGTRAKLR